MTDFKIDDRILRQIIQNTPEQVRRFMDAEAETVVNDIVKHFGVSPAAPNSPPGVDTGTLRASMRWEPGGDTRRLVMDGVLYGVYLELGSTRHGYVWPFMGPAFERERRAFGQHAQDAGLVKP